MIKEYKLHKAFGLLLVVALLSVMMPVGEAMAQTAIELGSNIATSLGADAISTDAYLGSGAWSANGTLMEFYLNPSAAPLNLGPITVNNVESITYRTKDGSAGGVDWGFYIYTKGGADPWKYGWYEERLISEPMYSLNYDGAPADTWNTWQTDSGTNQLAFYDSHYSAMGFYDGPSFADIKNGSFDWSVYGYDSTDIDYGSQEVLYFKFGTGSAWASTFFGLLDAIELKISGETYVINLEDLLPTVYVDDDWLGTVIGEDPDGDSGPAVMFGNDAFSSITEGINAVAEGGTVYVAPGTYLENVSIDKSITLVGSGNGEDPATSTIINAPSVGVGTGMTVNGPAVDQRIVVQNLAIQNFNYGLQLGYHVDLTDVIARYNSAGLKKATSADSGDIQIVGGGFNKNNIGWYIAASSSAGSFENISVTGTQFNNNATKGLYIEQMSNAVFDGIEVISSGVDEAYAWNAGIDINLKYGDYSNITIKNSTITDSGTLGSATNLLAPAAVCVKARDDGGYASNPATLTGVILDNNVISGPVNGLRFGEPVADGVAPNLGPDDVTLSNTTLSAETGQVLVNITQTELMVDDTNLLILDGVTLSDNYEIEDAVYHGLDREGAEAVYWNPANLYVTLNTLGVGNAAQVANAGDTITVTSGTFVGEVKIDRPLTLRGQGASTIIQSPDEITQTLYSSSHPILLVSETDNVLIEDLVVDGAGKGNGNYKFIGVGLYNSGVLIQDISILNIEDTPFSGSQHGVGLYGIFDDGTRQFVTIQNVLLEDFQKNAMAFNSYENTPVVLDIVGNTIIGKGATEVTAQNGIQVYGYGVMANIQNNTIRGIAYDNTNAATKWVASSILSYFANITVDGNQISEGHVGVYNYDGAGTIRDNSITIEKVGVYAFGIIATDPPQAVPSGVDVPETQMNQTNRLAALQVEILDNELTFLGEDNTDTYGIEADAGYGPEDLSLLIEGNILDGFDYGLVIYQDAGDEGVFTDVSAHYNCLFNTSSYGLWTNEDNIGLTIDAINNYWGHATGPYHPTLNVNGKGALVSETFVDFDPWSAFCEKRVEKFDNNIFLPIVIGN